MPNVKLHPSIIIYSVWDKEDADVIVGGEIVYSGTDYESCAQEVSRELWALELSAPVKARRTPRGQDMLWG